MLPSATTSVFRPTLEGEHLTPRRIRHITGIQVRNLTPFPVRDAFTSALDQPVDTGEIIDELGAPLANVRSRRISSASTATRRSLKREDNVVEQDIIVPSEVRGRRPSMSRVTFTNAPSGASNVSQRFSSSKSNLSLRSRTRTNSMTSSGSNQRLGSSLHLSTSSSLLPSNSQASLERVIGSRLVETFIVISIPPNNRPSDDASSQPTLSSTPKSSRSAPALKATFTPPPPSLMRPVDKKHRHSREASGASIRSNGRPSPHSAHPTNATFKSTSRTDAGKITSPRQITKSSSLSKGKAVASASVEVRPASPIYFSPIHNPSTNPNFAIDARAEHDFPSGCNDVGQFMKIEIWGKMSIPCRGNEKSPQEIPNTGDHDWRLLDDWDVDLDKMVLLSDDFDANSTHLPSNTLVLTLQPPGKRFYLPSSWLAAVPRPESPALGYSSDPESELRKVKHVTEQQIGCAATSIQSNGAPLSWKRRHKAAGNGFDPAEPAKTVAWQELFKVVTLQSLIADTQTSLNNVVESINGLLVKDEVFPLRRDLSERESRIREWRKNHCVVLDQIAQRKQDLSDRAQRLRERQELLATASKAITFSSAANLEIENQRNHLAQLRERSTAMQTSLISSLSVIYPIEMYSSTDLLFTILDIPLPIPMAANDPAPPLTLADNKDVTEESVAAALGHVAQVLQFLAAYMGKSLVYPVTCIGSRSLIRDGISTMVGPRMFPLFSKGVDTYRFEYGVFLLNKNIETLMAERDLRALDMRHTLPNLKNLLLTLSHDTPARLPPPLRTPSPIASTTESETPAGSSSASEESRTPKASHMTPSSMSVENTTPPESGTNTPTVSVDDQRKGKSFLGFVPFPDLLRVRYPSHSSDKTIRKGNATLLGEDGGTNEEERRTSHSVGLDMACKELGVASPAIGPEGAIEA